MIAQNYAAEPRSAAQAGTKFRMGLRLAACGLLILVFQCIFWVQQGDWTRLDLHTILVWLAVAPPMSDFPLGQTLIDVLLQAPLSALLIALGGLFACAGAASVETVEVTARYRP